MRIRQAATDIREVGHDILSATQSPKTGALLVNIGDSASGSSYDQGCPVWNATVGVMCMPANPTKGSNSCQTLEFTASNQNIVIACRDLRSAQSVGTLNPGDSCLYESAAGTSRIYARADGSISILANNGNQSVVIAPSGSITVTTSGDVKIDGGTVEVGPNATSVAIAGGAGALVLANAYTALVAALTTFSSSLLTASAVPTTPTSALSGLAPIATALTASITALPPPATIRTTAT